MNKQGNAAWMRSAERLLIRIMTAKPRRGRNFRNEKTHDIDDKLVAELIAADLIIRQPDGWLALTSAGQAFLRRSGLAQESSEIDPYVGQHLALARREIDTPTGKTRIHVDDSESPLAWLARRKGKDGRPLIEANQFQAGERLRAEFTRAQLMPRITSNWSAAVAQRARSSDGAGPIADVIVAARQRVRQALTAIGPEFAGLLLDICCFLKGLEDVERERGWPPRSAKVVLQLGLDRLARHYGLASEARGRTQAPVRTWLAADASFVVDGE